MKKTKSLIILSSFFVWKSLSLAQAPDTLWTKNYGYSNDDEAWQLKATDDGGYIIVGFSHSEISYWPDHYLIKTDENGDTLWTAKYDYSTQDIGRSVELLDDGEYVITGYCSGDWFLLKADSLGNEIWHNIPGIVSFCRVVRTTSDNGFIVAGYKYISVGNGFDFHLTKADSNGTISWSKNYGGSSEERAWDVCETPDGGFIILGWTESFGNGESDIYLIKTDADGDTIWTKTYGYADNDEGRSILINDDGGYVIAGKISGDYAYVFRTDINGDTIWTTTITEVGHSSANSISASDDGGYVLTGMRYGVILSSFVAKIDADGNLLWTAVLEDQDADLYCRSIVQSFDGGYVVAGYHHVPNRENEVFICKLAPDMTGFQNSVDFLPDSISILQNRPNPFNALATIEYYLNEDGQVRIDIFDLLGRKIRTLVDEHKQAGTYSITFDARNLSSGVYFYRLQAGDAVETKRMVLLK